MLKWHHNCGWSGYESELVLLELVRVCPECHSYFPEWHYEEVDSRPEDYEVSSKESDEE